MNAACRTLALMLLGLVGWVVVYCAVQADRQWQRVRRELRVSLAYQRGMLDEGARVAAQRPPERARTGWRTTGRAW